MDITLRWIHHQSWCEREQAHCCKVIELPIRPPPHHLSLSLRAPAHKIYEPWHEAIAIIKEKHDVKRRKNWIFQLHIFFDYFVSFTCLHWTDTATTQTDRDRPRRKKPNKKAWHEREFSQMVGGWLSADDWARALQLAMLIGENHARELTTERVSSRA